MLFIKKIFGFKTKVTEKELAELYWECCKKLSSSLYEITSKSADPNHDPDTEKMLEYTILSLWMFSNSFPSEKKVLDYLHSDIFIKRFCNTFNNYTEKKIKILFAERYTEYYQSLNDKGQAFYAPSVLFLKNVYGEDGKEQLNAKLAFEVSVHILSGMQFIKDIRQNYILK